MPPSLPRYGPYSHLQQGHLQQQQQSQQQQQQQQQQHQQQQQQQQQHHHSQAATGLPPNALAHNAFGIGSANSSVNPFTLAGANGVNVGTFPTTTPLNFSDAGNSGLASHAAQLSFVRGAQMQQQQQQQQQGGVHSAQDRLVLEAAKNSAKTRIRDVWKQNLEQEMHTIRSLIGRYPYVSMDTEFPGIVARPMGAFTSKADYHYQTLRCNVDLLKIIQLGITLSAEDGSLPPTHPTDENGHPIATNGLPVPCTWQFNFRFSLENDMYSSDSTSMLAKAGIDFAMHDKNGIDPHEFASLLMTSGLVLSDDVHWISFHSGYDFGYMMKILMCQPLPDDEVAFHKLLMIFFPSLYDVKYLTKHASQTQTVNDQPISQQAVQVFASLGHKSGLQDIADELEVKRTGIAHQAGSDSLVTGEIFWKLKQVLFNGYIDPKKYVGQIWGLNGVINPHYPTPNFPTPNLNGATIYNTAGTPGTPGAGHVAAMQMGSQGVAGGSALTPGGGAGVFGAFQFAKS